ncbi:MAG: sigma 54-interacting transcriptional regulator, partial [Verrucomicrobiota bacterium]
LLLDEIGSIPVEMQQKLLRALEAREIRPVGGTENINIDVRIVAATNEDLEEKIKQGTFREDLYYRLSIIPIELPPLRERRSDIKPLIKHFLKQTSEKEGRSIEIQEKTLQALENYDWPGNVRELENVINRATTLCENNNIELEDLPDKIQQYATAETEEAADEHLEEKSYRGTSLKKFLQSKEQDYIKYILSQNDGDKEKAADSLGISLATLYRKLDKS